jgi:hypothetical protein
MSVPYAGMPVVEVPEGIADLIGDVSDESFLYDENNPKKTRTTYSESGNFVPPLDVAYGNNDQDAEGAYKMACKRYKALSFEERKQTSVGAIAMMISQELHDKRQQEAAMKALKFSSEANKPMTKRVVKKVVKRKKPALAGAAIGEVNPQFQQPTKPSKLVRNVVAVAEPPKADFRVLGIPGLGPNVQEADIAVSMRYLENNRPVEQMFAAHWASLDQNSDGRVISADLVIDTRDGLLRDIPAFKAGLEQTMDVTISTEDDEIEFEAIRGMFQTNFGVFHLVKVLAAYNG